MENQITATIPEFCRMTGIGRSSVYELISEGAIDSVTMGRRRLIVIESYRALVARKRAEEQQQAMAGRQPHLHRYPHNRRNRAADLRGAPAAPVSAL
jgi:excisionase family DNA binding protein